MAMDILTELRRIEKLKKNINKDLENVIRNYSELKNS